MSESVETLIQRHRRFWKRDGDRGLLSVGSHRPLEDRGGLPLADGSRTAEGAHITPDTMVPEAFYRSPPLEEAVAGDFLRSESPPHLCWTEAAMGCPIRVATGGPWAEPVTDDPNRLLGREADARWYDLLATFTTFLAERAKGRYPVTQPLMRGPVDMMMSALGHERACLLLAEEPDMAERVLARCAEVFVEMARLRLDGTPAWHDGYLSSFGIWAPGSVVRTQLDNATMLSPDLYRRHVRDHDRTVIEAFDTSVMHVHSGCLHIAEALTEIDALTCIQVSIDYPGGPLADEVMPVLASILQRKALIVSGPVSASERAALEALEPSGGLCLQLRVVRDEAWLRDGLDASDGHAAARPNREAG